MRSAKVNSQEVLSSSRLTGIMLLVVAVTTLGGCGRSGGKLPVAMNASVPELLTKLPNLKPYDIQSCNYTIEKSSQTAWTPSPSDVRVELRGKAVLSEEGAKTLESTFDWKPVPREDLPASLLAILPPGDVLVNQKLNEGFEDNPTYRHGFIVTITMDGWSTVYFLATDLDHPIK